MVILKCFAFSFPLGRYVGCFKDFQKRTLPFARRDNKDNSKATCIKHCFNKGYAVAGMQNSDECFCGKAAPNGSYKVRDSECNKPCQGNKNEKCGGIWKNSVYLTGRGGSTTGNLLHIANFTVCGIRHINPFSLFLY